MRVVSLCVSQQEDVNGCVLVTGDVGVLTGTMLDDRTLAVSEVCEKPTVEYAMAHLQVP